MQCWDKRRLDIPIANRRNSKEKWGDVSQAHNLARQILVGLFFSPNRSEGLRIIIFGSVVCLPGPLGQQCHLHGLESVDPSHLISLQHSLADDTKEVDPPCEAKEKEALHIWACECD